MMKVESKFKARGGFSLPEVMIMMVVVVVMMAGAMSWFTSINNYTALIQKRSIAQAQLAPLLESDMTLANLSSLVFSGPTPQASPTSFGHFTVGQPITFSGGSATVDGILAEMSFSQFIAKREGPKFLDDSFWASLWESVRWAYSVRPDRVLREALAQPSPPPLCLEGQMYCTTLAACVDPSTCPTGNGIAPGTYSGLVKISVRLTTQNNQILRVDSKQLEALVYNPSTQLHPSVLAVGSDSIGNAMACHDLGLPLTCNLQTSQTNAIISGICSGDRIPGYQYQAPTVSGGIGRCISSASPSPSPSASCPSGTIWNESDHMCGTPCTSNLDCPVGNWCWGAAPAICVPWPSPSPSLSP